MENSNIFSENSIKKSTVKLSQPTTLCVEKGIPTRTMNDPDIQIKGISQRIILARITRLRNKPRSWEDYFIHGKLYMIMSNKKCYTCKLQNTLILQIQL